MRISTGSIIWPKIKVLFLFAVRLVDQSVPWEGQMEAAEPDLLGYTARQVRNRETFLLNFGNDFRAFDFLLGPLRSVWSRNMERRAIETVDAGKIITRNEASTIHYSNATPAVPLVSAAPVKHVVVAWAPAR